MLLVNTSDEEADELTKVVKGDMNEPDPTLVNEMETWRGELKNLRVPVVGKLSFLSHLLT